MVCCCWSPGLNVCSMSVCSKVMSESMLPEKLDRSEILYAVSSLMADATDDGLKLLVMYSLGAVAGCLCCYCVEYLAHMLNLQNF